jgi:hypothetical protein
MLLKRIFSLAICLACLWPASVGAQSSQSLAAVTVELWPEYDRPTMLVIYRLTLPPEVSLPADLTMRIPATVGKPSAVAARQVDGALFNLNYQQQLESNWLLVSLKATTLEVQIEYYDPALEKNDGSRKYVYQWPGDYSVQSFNVKIQQPMGATAMTISPSAGPGIAGSDGLIYYTKQVGELATGQSFKISVEYKKGSEDLTSTSLEVQPSSPINDQADGSLTITSALPWALGIAGLALLIGGGLWYWQSGRDKGRNRNRPRRRSAAQKEDATPAEEHIYCPQCGKRASPGDNFCRTCGAPLRHG